MALDYTDERLLEILRDLAAELGRSPTQHELKARRDLPALNAYINRFGSWNAALEAAGLATYRRSLIYSDEQLLQTLRDLAAELGRSPTGNEMQARHDLPSAKVYYVRFKSWLAALEAAGLAAHRRHTLVYSDEQLLQTLRDLAAELGRSPTRDELKARRDLPALSTYERRFTRWTAALKAAGLQTRRTLVYSDEQLLQILRDLAAKLGQSPAGHELEARRDLPSLKTYYERFGSWLAALAAAGLQPRRPPVYTGEQLLQSLRDLAAELGRSPTSRELGGRRDLPSPKAYERYFKSWNAALEAAGLATRRYTPAYSDEQLLQTLRDLAAELGRSPTTHELQARRDLPSSITYANHFGSWNAALEAAGLEIYRRPPAHSDEQLLQILRDLAAELSRTPTQRELRACRDLPSPNAYKRHFGSWTAALEAAGLKLNRARGHKPAD